MKLVSISIKKSTKKELEKFGRMNSDYDSIIQEILKHVDTCDRFWENRFE